jgi:hypothetical protein
MGTALFRFNSFKHRFRAIHNTHGRNFRFGSNRPRAAYTRMQAEPEQIVLVPAHEFGECFVATLAQQRH